MCNFDDFTNCSSFCVCVCGNIVKHITFFVYIFEFLKPSLSQLCPPGGSIE